MSIPSPKRGVLLSDPSHVNGGVRRGPARKPVDETNFGVRRLGSKANSCGARP